jgi:hypothetical protein
MTSSVKSYEPAESRGGDLDHAELQCLEDSFVNPKVIR